jgi:glycosyltransferase involved in cell wall biosynthesis
MTLHDYFLLCPEWNMIGPSGGYCGLARAQNQKTCVDCLASKHKALRPDMEFDFGAYIEDRNRHVDAALEACDVLIVPSAFVKKQFQNAHGDDFGRKIRIIPHGTQPYPFNPTHQPKKNLRVAFLGNMNRAKGSDVFLEVVKRLRRQPIKFRVYGGTSLDMDATSIKNLVFMGKYERSELSQRLQDVDVVVIPSVWHETYCYTVDEAFRAGVPIIASRVGAIQERIQDGKTGILVEMNDVDSLERAILTIDGSRGLLATFRENIAKLRLKTDEANMAEYAALYESLSGAKLDKGDLIADRMSANRTINVFPQLTMEEYCSRHKMPSPLAKL